MPTEFRHVRASEMRTVVNLWNEVFGVGHHYFESLLHSEPGWDERQSLVAVEDGEVVSSVHIFLREVYGLEGRKYKVGCIGSVSTRESSRGKGYSGKLLVLALDTMRSLNCDWSWLFTGTNRHYARYGWVDLPTRRVFASEPSQIPAAEYEKLEVANWDLTWPQLRTVHEVCHCNRPLTTIRTEDHWRNAVRYRAFAPVAQTRFIRVNGEVVAYASISFGSREHEVRDLAWLPGHEAKLASLLAGASREGELIIVTPIDESARQILDTAYGQWRVEPAPWSMVQPLKPEITMEELELLFSNPAAVHFASDEF